MNRRQFASALAMAAAAGALAKPALAQDKKFTIALIPGLTTDAFYITMNASGAQAAAKALGITLGLPGRRPSSTPTLQTFLCSHAVIARQPGRDPDRADRQDSR